MDAGHEKTSRTGRVVVSEPHKFRGLSRHNTIFQKEVNCYMKISTTGGTRLERVSSGVMTSPNVC
jgi:hypothetical protein